MLALLSDSTKRIVGARQIARAAAQGRLSMVFIAADADERVLGPIREACARAGIAVEQVESMESLGKACRISVGAAAAGILKEGGDGSLL